VLGALVRAAYPVIRASFTIPNVCIAATELGIEALSYFKVPARPLVVQVSIFNEKGLEATRQDLPVAEWPKGAHSVGIGRGRGHPDQPGWDGHLVVLTSDAMTDLTIDSANRPKYGMELHPAVLQVTEAFKRGEQGMAYTIGTCAAVYHALPNDRSYCRTPDWLERKACRPLVAEIIRRMKQELG
jgi:hypothetical protein